MCEGTTSGGRIDDRHAAWRPLLDDDEMAMLPVRDNRQGNGGEALRAYTMSSRCDAESIRHGNERPKACAISTGVTELATLRRGIVHAMRGQYHRQTGGPAIIGSDLRIPRNAEPLLHR
jgi:hypothetical protein